MFLSAKSVLLLNHLVHRKSFAYENKPKLEKILYELVQRGLITLTPNGTDYYLTVTTRCLSFMQELDVLIIRPATDWRKAEGYKDAHSSYLELSASKVASKLGMYSSEADNFVSTPEVLSLFRAKLGAYRRIINSATGESLKDVVPRVRTTLTGRQVKVLGVFQMYGLLRREVLPNYSILPQTVLGLCKRKFLSHNVERDAFRLSPLGERFLIEFNKRNIREPFIFGESEDSRYERISGNLDVYFYKP